MSSVDPGFISAVIVRYADDPRLEACLESLKRQEGVELEVILVENGSVGAKRPRPSPGKRLGGPCAARCVAREANPGFAAAFNEACGRARGGLILSVTPDCRLDPEAVRAARDRAARRPRRRRRRVSSLATRPERSSTRPGSSCRSGHPPGARSRSRRAGRAGRFTESAHGRRGLPRRRAPPRESLEAARDGAGEILDRRYFAYQEDVDLGWRMRRAGFRIVYEPSAVGEHERRWREGGRREIPVPLRRASLRNRWFTILKNVSWPGLLWRLPFLAAFELLLLAKLLVTEPAVVPAYASAIAGIPGTLASRRRRGGHDAARDGAR